MANRFVRFEASEGDEPVFIEPGAVQAVQAVDWKLGQPVCWLRLGGGGTVPVACSATDAAALIERALAEREQLCEEA
jgi:hypothetical protein